MSFRMKLEGLRDLGQLRDEIELLEIELFHRNDLNWISRSLASGHLVRDCQYPSHQTPSGQLLDHLPPSFFHCEIAELASGLSHPSSLVYRDDLSKTHLSEYCNIVIVAISANHNCACPLLALCAGMWSDLHFSLENWDYRVSS